MDIPKKFSEPTRHKVKFPTLQKHFITFEDIDPDCIKLSEAVAKNSRF
jgi:hypothetical protein